MMQRLFYIVADFLDFIGRKTGFTYNEVNIIVYFFVIPFTWLAMLDILLDFPYLKIAFAIFTLGFMAGCRDFPKYSDWLFDRSVDFLNYFNRFGSNYTASSVWICVAVPIVIYAVLFVLILR